MRRSSTGVDDFRDHVGFVLRPVLSQVEGLSPKGGRPARSARTGAISIAVFYLESAHSLHSRQRRRRSLCHARCIRAVSSGVGA